MRADPSLVSVIIPTHNRASLLPAALESALAQSYPDVEVIVIDDGSTDMTPQVAGAYAGRVTYLRQANQGVAAARNSGLSAARGAYVTFLDDDDLILPDKIARQVRALEARPEAGLAHCRYYFADPGGNFHSQVGHLPEGEVLPELVQGNFVWMGAPLIRRSCIDAVGPFDPRVPSVTADWDMWLRVALGGFRFACVQEPLGVYRIQPDSMMSDVLRLEEGVFAVLDKAFTSPHLSAGVAALRPHAYGAMRFWVSCRYYAAGQWDDARRNLAEALALRPEWQQPARLTPLLRDDALSSRVDDPLRFVGDVLEHLPAAAAGLWHLRACLLGHVHLGLAMRTYAVGEVGQAQEHIARAVSYYPQLVKEPGAFIESLSHYAMHLPVASPPLYVDTVIQNLPEEAKPLAQVRTHVLSQVTIGCAFQDFAGGHRRLALQRILRALRYRPAWIKNRGVVSIILRSLLGSMREGSHP